MKDIKFFNFYLGKFHNLVTKTEWLIKTLKCDKTEHEDNNFSMEHISLNNIISWWIFQHKLVAKCNFMWLSFIGLLNVNQLNIGRHLP